MITSKRHPRVPRRDDWGEGKEGHWVLFSLSSQLGRGRGVNWGLNALLVTYRGHCHVQDLCKQEPCHAGCRGDFKREGGREERRERNFWKGNKRRETATMLISTEKAPVRDSHPYPTGSTICSGHQHPLDMHRLS